MSASDFLSRVDEWPNSQLLSGSQTIVKAKDDYWLIQRSHPPMAIITWVILIGNYHLSDFNPTFGESHIVKSRTFNLLLTLLLVNLLWGQNLQTLPPYQRFSWCLPVIKAFLMELEMEMEYTWHLQKWLYFEEMATNKVPWNLPFHSPIPLQLLFSILSIKISLNVKLILFQIS